MPENFIDFTSVEATSTATFKTPNEITEHNCQGLASPTPSPTPLAFQIEKNNDNSTRALTGLHSASSHPALTGQHLTFSISSPKASDIPPHPTFSGSDSNFNQTPTKLSFHQKSEDFISKYVNSEFLLYAENLSEFVEKYLTRTYVEELNCLQEVGGIEFLGDALQVELKSGLANPSNFTKRVAHFGSNVPLVHPVSSIWSLIWQALSDLTLRILLIAGLSSVLLGIFLGENPKVDWIEGMSIWVAVIIVVVITAGNDWVKEREFEKLGKLKSHNLCTVLRDAQFTEIAVGQLMVGDILRIEMGDEIAADGIILTCQNLKIDESSLTGETNYPAKNTFQVCYNKFLDYQNQHNIDLSRCKGSNPLKIWNSNFSIDNTSQGNESDPSKQPLVNEGAVKSLTLTESQQVGARLYGKISNNLDPTNLALKDDKHASDYLDNSKEHKVEKQTILKPLNSNASLPVENGPYNSAKHAAITENIASNQLPSNLYSRVPSPIVLSGTNVCEGTATILVLAVGPHAQSGKTMQKLAIHAEVTPLQKKLNALARDIGKVGFIAAVTTFFILTIQFWISWGVSSPENRAESNAILNQHVHFFVAAITILVVSIPEGLPLAVTVSLAYSIAKMLKDNNYVRRLSSCEIMGGATDICSDKTGTLTKNRMSVEAHWNGSATSFSLEDIKCRMAKFPEKYLEILMESISVNSTGYIEVEKVAIVKNILANEVHHVGSPTECGLLQIVKDFNYSYETLRQTYGSNEQIVFRKLFTSDRKMMTTIVKYQNRYRVHVKGAAEKVLKLCNYRISSIGKLSSLTEQEKKDIEEVVIYQMASRALRTICVAYKDLDIEKMKFNVDDTDFNEILDSLESDLICLSIFGLKDPVRDEVPGAIMSCQSAGIRVRMVTGDNIETAKQIALKCNIYHPESGGIAMLGSEFTKLVGGVICQNCGTAVCDCPLISNNDKQPKRVDVLKNQMQFDKISDRLEILARSQPTDKYALVVGLKSQGAIVAVTGDGVNDAPALKRADVGFAMGIAGKETTKQAADIILLDDNFESIVKAVLWGRNIHDNIRRFLQFQLTVNVVAVSVAVLSAIISRDTPLTAVQLLWINLIMDSFASLALATELPSPNLLKRKPQSVSEYLLNRYMIRNILGQALFQLVMLLFIIYMGERFVPEIPWNISDSLRKSLNFCEFSDCLPDYSGSLIRSGRQFYPFSATADYTEKIISQIGHSRHYTFVFNTFVFFQIFNLLPSRKIHGELNMFTNLNNSNLWFLITGIIIALQILIIQFGGRVMSCHPEGLTLIQWFLSIGLGALCWIVFLLIRIIPIKILHETGKKEIDPLDEPLSIALASRGRFGEERLSKNLIKSSTLIGRHV